MATLTNGKITAEVSPEGWIRFLNQRGEVLTEEYWRNRNRINRYCVPLRVDARELKPVMGSCDYELTARFEAYDDEKFSAWGSIRKSIWIKKAPLWSLPSGIPRQACLLCFQQRLWLPLEQPGNRHGNLRYQQDGMVCEENQEIRLFHHGRRYPGGN